MVDSNVAMEIEHNHFTSEASMLDIPPGSGWPLSLETSLGNGHDFFLVRACNDFATYYQVMGCISLTVYND